MSGFSSVLGSSAGQSVLGGVGDIFGNIAGPIAEGLTSGLQKAFEGVNSKHKANALAQIPTVQKPNYPGFSSLLGANGQLPQNLQLKGNTEALTALRNNATSAAPSAWATMRMNEIDAQAPGQMNQLNKNNAGALATARNQMMAEGGLSSSISQKLGQQNNLQSMMARQNLRSGIAQNKADINLSDAQNKQSQLQALPGLELQSLAPQQYNLQNIISQNAAGNTAENQRYQQEMQAWAASKTGNAIANSGKK